MIDSSISILLALQLILMEGLISRVSKHKTFGFTYYCLPISGVLFKWEFGSKHFFHFCLWIISFIKGKKKTIFSDLEHQLLVPEVRLTT